MHARGWVGGEYKVAGKWSFFRPEPVVPAMPPQLRPRKNALFVTALSTNTPAALAGVREGDLILELNHTPMMRLKDFRRTIDRSEPGTSLPVKVYRNGETNDYSVVVGRETFRYQGTFAVVFPPIVRGLDLWPDPDFSLIVLGYQTETKRVELDSVESNYIRSCHPKWFHAEDGDGNAWLVIFRLSKSKLILSQEIVPSPTASVAAR